MAYVSLSRKCAHCQTEFKPLGAKQYCCSNLCSLWRLIDKRGPDECWPWIGKAHVGVGGYGCFVALRGSDMCKKYSRMMTQSRAAYILLNGPIKNRKLVVRHTCDNRICSNPKHLILGTRADNARDMFSRGRASPTRGFLKWRPTNPDGELQITDIMLTAGMTEARRCPSLEAISAAELSPLVSAIYTAMMRWRMDPKGEFRPGSVVVERRW